MVGAIPLFMTTSEGVDIETSLTISSGESPSPSSITPQQGPGGDSVSDVSVKITEVRKNGYETLLGGSEDENGEDDVEVTEGESSGSDVVEITITFELTTPNGKTLSFEFSPGEMAGTGEKTMNVLLDPEDLNGEVGTFHISITITILVTPPASQAPALEKTITAVDRTFEITA